MRLLLAALLTVIVGWGVVLAAPKASARHRTGKPAARRETAEQMCKAQGPTCRVVARPEAPKDLTGLGCVCDPAVETGSAEAP